MNDIAKTALDIGAHLHVLSIGMATFVPMTIYAETPYYDWNETYSQVIKDTAQKAIELKQYLTDLGVSFTVSKISDVTGSIASTVSQYALYADFAMLPVSNQKTTDEALNKMFIDGVMFNANIPTILLPSGTTIGKVVDQAVIGWYPSPNAAASVRSSLLLLNTTTEVSIAIVDPAPSEYGQDPGIEIAAYLARHNLNAEIEENQ